MEECHTYIDDKKHPEMGVDTHLSICSAWWAQRMAAGGGHGPAPSLFTPGCWRIVEDELQCGLMFVPSFLISSPKGASRPMTHHHCPQSSWETSVSSSAHLSEVHSDFLFQIQCFCEACLLRLAEANEQDRIPLLFTTLFCHIHWPAT